MKKCKRWITYRSKNDYTSEIIEKISSKWLPFLFTIPDAVASLLFSTTMAANYCVTAISGGTINAQQTKNRSRMDGSDPDIPLLRHVRQGLVKRTAFQSIRFTIRFRGSEKNHVSFLSRRARWKWAYFKKERTMMHTFPRQSTDHCFQKGHLPCTFIRGYGARDDACNK